jgi:hypothetical protein
MSTAKRLSAAISARDQLVTRLSDAEVKIIERQTAAEQLALDGADDDKLSAAEDKLRAAQDRRVTLRSALVKAEADVARLETERNVEIDKALREQTAKEVEQLARRVSDSADAFVKAAEVYADYLAKVTFVPESAALLHLCQVCVKEALPTNDTVVRLMRQHGASVLAGSAPAMLKPPPEAYVAPTVNKPATTQVFVLHAIQFVDHEGVVRKVGKWRDVSMVPALAEKAIRLRLCAPLSDPIRKTHFGQSPGHPEPAWLNDLDRGVGPDIATQSAAEPVLHSAFEKPTIGPARVLKIARES